MCAYCSDAVCSDGGQQLVHNNGEWAREPAKGTRVTPPATHTYTLQEGFASTTQNDWLVRLYFMAFFIITLVIHALYIQTLLALLY